MKTTLERHTEALVANAAAWRLASLLLERPRALWKSEIEALAPEVTDAELTECARLAPQASEELYQRLFGPGGTVSPREVSYCGLEDPGRLMAELQTFYSAFAFEPRREESIDHISVLAGFIGYLSLKQAFAQERGDSAAASVTQQAKERFSKEHLARCARGVMARLQQGPAYLQGILAWVEKSAGASA